MKKIYLCLSLLLATFGVTTSSAENVVESLGDPITSLSGLQEGSQVVLYNTGRYGYLKENTDLQLQLVSSVGENTLSSEACIWTLTNVSTSDGNVVAQFKSASGNFIPELPTTSAVSSSMTPDNFTIMLSGSGDGLWAIQGTNGNYFNGNNVINGVGEFTGWGSNDGANGHYQIFVPTLKEVTSASVTLSYYDEDYNSIQDEEVRSVVLGSAIESAPAIEHYDYLYGTDENNNDIEFPYTVEEDGHMLMLIYEQWPLVKVTCVDESGNTLSETSDYLQKGTVLTVPSFVGYDLVTTGYDNYVINESQEITLTYALSDNLPFKPTTIADGQFAEDTQWYLVRLNSQFYFQYQPAATDSYEFAETLDEAADSLLWCFTGNLIDGFKIYNKAAGPTKVLALNSAASQAYPLMLEESSEPAFSTFQLLENSPAYALLIKGTDNACLNNFGEYGKLSVWADAASPTNPGSRIEFIIDDPVARAMEKYTSYLYTADVVGGWKEADLAALRDAYEAQSPEGCEAAIAALAEADTIAFDANQAYEIVSAYRGFQAQQGKNMAIYSANDATNGDHLAWKELDSDDINFRFYFVPGSADNTWNLCSYASYVNDGTPKYMKTYRWQGVAPLGTDEPADITLVKNTAEPAAWTLIHIYATDSGTDKVTLDCFNGTANGATESGYIKTYNTTGVDYANSWRLRPVGELTGINGAVNSDNATVNGNNNGAIYDLTGRRVVKPTTGIYIINGKKVYMK